VLLAGCHGAQAEDQMPLTRGWISPIKKTPQPLRRAVPNALAAFVKRPQAEAQIGADGVLTSIEVFGDTFSHNCLRL